MVEMFRATDTYKIILKYLLPNELFKARRVCKAWDTMILQIIQNCVNNTDVAKYEPVTMVLGSDTKISSKDEINLRIFFGNVLLSFAYKINGLSVYFVCTIKAKEVITLFSGQSKEFSKVKEALEIASKATIKILDGQHNAVKFEYDPLNPSMEVIETKSFDRTNINNLYLYTVYFPLRYKFGVEFVQGYIDWKKDCLDDIFDNFVWK